jgi:hypothetical protein
LAPLLAPADEPEEQTVSATVAYPKQDTRPGLAPDIREDDTQLKVQRGNFVAVPIPVANPTFGDGLVVGAAYFYPQTEEEKAIEPASVTALGGFYASNNSQAVVLAQQNYWRGKWRFTGAVAAADLRLSLLTADGTSNGQGLDWHVHGNLVFAKLARRLKGDWYGGAQMRVIDANQSLETPSQPSLLPSSKITSSGVGVYFEYDTRDMPLNSYSGRYLKVDALFNDESIGSDATYQNYSAAFRSYHKLSGPIVLAWEVQGCNREGTAPLWDACTVTLRGFSATDYLAKSSASAQAEARWQLNRRWGLVGFGGAGYVGGSFNGIREREAIPSYGVGIRFSVLPAKRINLRIDYAQSTNSSAIHVSLGEAF